MEVHQVKFRTEDSPDKWLGGIMVDDEYIIYGCCGSIFDSEEILDGTVLEIRPLKWIDISDAIKGDD